MSVMEQETVRSRRSFTDEFKRDAVALVIDEDRKVIDVARSLGVGASERTELAELRKENARLRVERDLLKRATAFWVKESGQ